MNHIKDQHKRALWYRIVMRMTVFAYVFFVLPLRVSAQGVLPQEALVDLVKPSVVRIAEHVTGTAKIPEIKVDIRKRLMAVVPDTFTEVPVDEYLSGSGFIIHPDGYIATNAHVVSQETVKRSLASESALSALFENALFLSDVEMEAFLESDDGESFSKKILQYVIDQSVFDLTNEVAVLRPDSGKTKMADLIATGFPAEIIFVNNAFAEDERDVAIIKIQETNLPAMYLGASNELVVGKKSFIFGFPATAEVNENNPAEATFTQGVVSAIKQSSDRSFSIFQTDAKVSEGSSGGPLFNEYGEAVGIITFQTGGLDRVSGDNFAFALPIEIVKEAALEARVLPTEGEYRKAFIEGFMAFSEKHCDKALTSFGNAKNATNPIFGVGKYLEPYEKKCEMLKQTGASLDTGFDELRGTVRSLSSPFVYLLGGGLLLFGVFGAAFFWLLRQVRREEHEIEVLNHRLEVDEMRIRAYKNGMAPRERSVYVGVKKNEGISRLPERKKVI